MGSFRFEYEKNGQVQTFPFDGDSITVGRDKSSDFVLDHPTVSRQHAVVVDDGGGEFRLVVLSQGGLTAVDGDKIEGDAQLYDESLVHFGELNFHFRSELAPPKPNKSSGGEAAADGSAGSPTRESQSSDTVSSSAEAGIESWDEIAQSAEEEEKSYDETTSQRSLADNLEDGPGQKGGGDGEEETSPVLVGGALILIVGMMSVLYWPSGDQKKQQQSDILDQEGPSIEVEVKCLSHAECMKAAGESYDVGIEYLNKQDAEVGNLFEGYKRLLEAKSYLEQSNRKSPPKEMSDLESRLKQARNKLDQVFRNYRVKYFSAKKNGQHRQRAQALQTIQNYFPHNKAREHKWANQRILKMKERGIYPRNLGGGY
jgi:pSer/pThr/pTyr-binding forkhead associated (FHA) protein